MNIFLIYGTIDVLFCFIVAGHWNDGSNESGPPFGSFGGNDGGFEGFDE